MTEAEQYARWVLAPENHFRNGRLMKLAAERFLRDLTRTDIYFDTQCIPNLEHEGAYFLVNFAEKHCFQWEGDWMGKPVLWEPWQKFCFMQVYGWKIKATDRRRFNTVYIQISKKNGKSTMSAVLADGHVFADKRVNTPKVFTAANNEDQAKISVNMAGQIIKSSPDLFEYVEEGDVKLMTYGKDITQVIHRERNGFIMALSKETDDATSKTAGGKHGINASLGIVDEFGMSKDYGASGSIKTSMASRAERLMFYITTAGYNKEGPCFSDLRDTGIKVLEGVIEMDGYLPLIFEIDSPIGQDKKPQPITIDYLLANPQVWQQSNPNLGVSVYEDFLRDELLAAKLKGGRIATDCLTLNFNLWVDSPEVFIPADVWNSNTFGEEPEEGAECFGGLEIATGMGMSAFLLYFPGEINKIKALFWMPSEGARTDGGFDGYDRWSKDGFIKIDPGNVVENSVALQWIKDFVSQYNMTAFGFPKPMENNSIVQGLINAGYQHESISQGILTVSTPTAEWEKLFIARKMEHYGNPVLTWANSNCMAVRKEQGIRLEKNQKVLSIHAGLNALTTAMIRAAGVTNDQMIEIW